MKTEKKRDVKGRHFGDFLKQSAEGEKKVLQN